jgi:BirA family biotin operon repressor/biotin-[acetyl-CoA-carboxylase] ligase
MTPAGPHVPLLIDELRRARATARIGRTIHYFDSVDSTNTVARTLAADGAAEGTVVIAEEQTKGRGRLGRTWVSPPFRNLYISIILRPPITATEAAQLTLVAGVAVAEAVCDWAPQVAIKWPNDIVIDGRKVAGILTEMEADDGRVHFVILGIGVNLNSAPEDFPPALRDTAGALCAAAGRPIDRVACAERLLSRLEERYDLFVSEGFAAIRPLWESRSCLTGRQVETDAGGQRCHAVVTGIADDGTLLLRGPAGQELRVVAGDVTVIDGYDEEPSAGSGQQSGGKRNEKAEG